MCVWRPLKSQCLWAVTTASAAAVYRTTGTKTTPRPARSVEERVNFALKQLTLSFNAEAEERVCRKHPRGPALFCLDEDRALCCACEFSQHLGHTVVSVEEAVFQIKLQLQSELKPLTECREQASALQRQYEEVRVHSERQAEECACHITQHFEQLHQFLQREEELRLTALREEHSRQLQTMKSELQKVRELLTTLNNNISTVE